MGVRQHASESTKKNTETVEGIAEWHLDTQNHCWQQLLWTTMPHPKKIYTYPVLEPSLMQSIPDGMAFISQFLCCNYLQILHNPPTHYPQGTKPLDITRKDRPAVPLGLQLQSLVMLRVRIGEAADAMQKYQKRYDTK